MRRDKVLRMMREREEWEPPSLEERVEKLERVVASLYAWAETLQGQLESIQNVVREEVRRECSKG